MGDRKSRIHKNKRRIKIDRITGGSHMSAQRRKEKENLL